MGKTYELGGPEVFTMEQLVQLMFEAIREEPRYIKIPIPIARLLASPREFLIKKVPFPLPTPVIFNQAYVDSLSVDNVVSQNALTFRDLGIIPRKLKGYPIDYLLQYRTGGPSYGATVGDRVSGPGF